jgi:hypothetical protein
MSGGFEFPDEGVTREFKKDLEDLLGTLNQAKVAARLMGDVNGPGDDYATQDQAAGQSSSGLTYLAKLDEQIGFVRNYHNTAAKSLGETVATDQAAQDAVKNAGGEF